MAVQIEREIPDELVPKLNESLFFPSDDFQSYFEIVASAKGGFWIEAVSIPKNESFFIDRPVRRNALLWFAEKEGFDLLNIIPSRSEVDSADFDERRHKEWRERALPKKPWTRREKARPSYLIYFMQSVDGGPIKIGLSKSPDERRRQLQVYCPRPLIILACIRSSQGFTERRIHKRFSDERLHNEWFEPSDDLLRFISKHATKWEDMP